MKQVLIDTDILSMFFRDNPEVVARFDTYLAEHGQINISIITFYEILSGLKHRDAQKQLASFLDFAAQNNIIPLTEQSAMLSAQIYADARANGLPIDDIDILITGIALANDWTLVTHNQKHFAAIDRLQIQDWHSMNV